MGTEILQGLFYCGIKLVLYESCNLTVRENTVAVPQRLHTG